MKIKIVSIVIAITLIYSCSNKNKQSLLEENSPEDSNFITLTEKQAKNANIETCEITSSQMSYVEKVNGSLEVPPQNLISISCPTGGYLTQTKLLPGMKVSKGEAIATITDQQFIQLQQDYLSAKSKIHFSELEYKRQKSLAENEATSDKALQLTNADLQQSRIMLATLSEKLKLININPANVSNTNIRQSISLFSPITGFVNKVNVNIGKYVSPSEVLFEIINPSDIHLNLKIFEKVAQHIKIGQRVIAYSNTNLSKKYECEVILISKEVDANGLVEVHCHFKNYDPSLIVGMYMNAELETENSLQNALPIDCITSFEGKNYVFVSTSKNSYQMHEVEIGNEVSSLVEIKNAHMLNDKRIVSKGAYTLLMALKNIAE